MKDKPSTEPRSFWEEAGENFPPFFDAPSTAYYLEGEQRIFSAWFPDLPGKKILKTDLWDEAKNTRILAWAAARGARVFGLDISLSMIRQARGAFPRRGRKPGLVVSDIRAAAFRECVFDYLYSMGTIEHFEESQQAVRECYRLLRPGGRAVIGVPNKHDPFLRPFMVTVLRRLGLYAYGYERSFSMGGLETVLCQAGFRVLGRTSILFLPGWLRMADLWLHVRRPGLSFLLKPLIDLFARLHRRWPFLERRGYLIACLAEKQE